MLVLLVDIIWWQELDLNQRPLAYEASEITTSPSCFMAPPVRLERTTTLLTARRSTY
nr:MAG TPA: hypothetical protein [Caudoviricetes sp.]